MCGVRSLPPRAGEGGRPAGRTQAQESEERAPPLLALEDGAERGARLEVRPDDGSADFADLYSRCEVAPLLTGP